MIVLQESGGVGPADWLRMAFDNAPEEDLDYLENRGATPVQVCGRRTMPPNRQTPIPDCFNTAQNGSDPNASVATS